MSFESALSGETYTTVRLIREGAVRHALAHQGIHTARNAASVLPEPVGAAIST